MNDTPDADRHGTHVLIDVPGGARVVGAYPRPPRILTTGRRVSDRAVAYALAGLLVTACLFVLWVALQVGNMAADLHRLADACGAR